MGIVVLIASTQHQVVQPPRVSPKTSKRIMRTHAASRRLNSSKWSVRCGCQMPCRVIDAHNNVRSTRLVKKSIHVFRADL
jgi:hypothetical protein